MEALHRPVLGHLDPSYLGLVTELPEGLEDGPARKRLLADYGIEVGGGLGTFAGRAWRIGTMGQAATERSVVTLLGAARELLKA